MLFWKRLNITERPLCAWSSSTLSYAFCCCAPGPFLPQPLSWWYTILHDSVLQGADPAENCPFWPEIATKIAKVISQTAQSVQRGVTGCWAAHLTPAATTKGLREQGNLSLQNYHLLMFPFAFCRALVRRLLLGFSHVLLRHRFLFRFGCVSILVRLPWYSW